MGKKANGGPKAEMQPIQIRLTYAQVKFLDKKVTEGFFPTRSEVLRSLVSNLMMRGENKHKY